MNYCKCYICGGLTKTDYVVKYSLPGGGEFQQEINICDQCGFVFSSNKLP